MQERIMTNYKAKESEMMQWSNLLGCGNTVVWLIVGGDLFPAFHFCKQNSYLYPFFLLTGFLGYIAANSVVRVIQLAGPVTASIMGSARKIVALILSFLIFPKPFTPWYVYSGAIFFTGVFMNTYASIRAKQQQKLPPPA